MGLHLARHPRRARQRDLPRRRDQPGRRKGLHDADGRGVELPPARRAAPARPRVPVAQWPPLTSLAIAAIHSGGPSARVGARAEPRLLPGARTPHGPRALVARRTARARRGRDDRLRAAAARSAPHPRDLRALRAAVPRAGARGAPRRRGSRREPERALARRGGRPRRGHRPHPLGGRGHRGRPRRRPPLRPLVAEGTTAHAGRRPRRRRARRARGPGGS